jgi:hypothetical protein
LKEKVLKLGSKSFFFLKTSLNETAVFAFGTFMHNLHGPRFFFSIFSFFFLAFSVQQGAFYPNKISGVGTDSFQAREAAWVKTLGY